LEGAHARTIKLERAEASKKDKSTIN